MKSSAAMDSRPSPASPLLWVWAFKKWRVAAGLKGVEVVTARTGLANAARWSRCSTGESAHSIADADASSFDEGRNSHMVTNMARWNFNLIFKNMYTEFWLFGGPFAQTLQNVVTYTGGRSCKNRAGECCELIKLQHRRVCPFYCWCCFLFWRRTLLSHGNKNGTLKFQPYFKKYVNWILTFLRIFC